jgi:hypothetical protein
MSRSYSSSPPYCLHGVAGQLCFLCFCSQDPAHVPYVQPDESTQNAHFLVLEFCQFVANVAVLPTTEQAGLQLQTR